MTKPLLLLAVILANIAIPGAAQSIKITAPETLVPLVKKWADAYPASASAKIEVSAVASSEASFDALKSKQADLAGLSRRLKRKEAEAAAAELGERPHEYKVAVCAVAVYVNTNNGVKALDLDQLESIVKGDTSSWKDAGAKEGSISVYLPKDSPRVMEYVRDEFLVGKAMPATVHVVPAGDLPKAVASDKNAIGFGDALAPEGIRVLGIKRAQSSPPEVPTLESIAQMDYAVARYVYQTIAASADTGAAKAWLDWVRSDDGQKVIEGTGFYPIPIKQRSNPAK